MEFHKQFKICIFFGCVAFLLFMCFEFKATETSEAGLQSKLKQLARQALDR